MSSRPRASVSVCLAPLALSGLELLFLDLSAGYLSNLASRSIIYLPNLPYLFVDLFIFTSAPLNLSFFVPFIIAVSESGCLLDDMVVGLG